MAIVSVVCPPQNTGDNGLAEALSRLLAPLGGVAFLAGPGEQPLVYLGQIWPGEPALGLNPQPLLLQALQSAFLEVGAAAPLFAGCAAPGFTWRQALEYAGYGLLAEQGLRFVDLAGAPLLERDSKLDLAYAQLSVPAVLVQNACLINLAKYRTAEGLLFGAALLNWEAVLPEEIAADHKARALLDLYSIVTPDLHLVDGLRGSQGYQPQAVDILLAGQDTVALDMVLASLSNLQPGQIELLNLAAQYGLGSSQAGEIHLVGDDLREILAE